MYKGSLELRVHKCRGCGAILIHFRMSCPDCGAENQWQVISTRSLDMEERLRVIEHFIVNIEARAI